MIAWALRSSPCRSASGRVAVTQAGPARCSGGGGLVGCGLELLAAVLPHEPGRSWSCSPRRGEPSQEVA